MPQYLKHADQIKPIFLKGADEVVCVYCQKGVSAKENSGTSR